MTRRRIPEKSADHAKENITSYHEKQLKEGYEIKKANGIILGQIVRGLARVGIYVPGGTAAYPSTVLMNAIPAKIAGVKEIVMITPPIIEKQEKWRLGLQSQPGYFSRCLSGRS